MVRDMDLTIKMIEGKQAKAELVYFRRAFNTTL
jgi:hypothetical protein